MTEMLVSETKKRTILPEAKMSAVVFGSLILIMTAAKRCKQLHHKCQYTKTSILTVLAEY